MNSLLIHFSPQNKCTWGGSSGSMQTWGLLHIEVALNTAHLKLYGSCGFMDHISTWLDSCLIWVAPRRREERRCWKWKSTKYQVSVGKVSSKCPHKKTSNQGAWARNAVMRKSRVSQDGRSLWLQLLQSLPCPGFLLSVVWAGQASSMRLPGKAFVTAYGWKIAQRVLGRS